MKIPRVSFFKILTFTLICLMPIGKLHAAARTFCVDDASDGSATPGDCDTNCTDGSNNCSLRDAITAANSNTGTDTIIFKIPGNGVHTIQPTAALPDITDPVIIDGYTQTGASPNTNGPGSGSNSVLLIEIDGTNAGANVNGLHITGGGSIVRGLVINRFTNYGVSLDTGGNNLLEGNFIGTNPAGDTDLGNTNSGVIVASSSGNTIGGTAPASRNLISGNDFYGLNLSGAAATGNIVQGNFIGTNAAGTGALPNTRFGVLIDSQATQNTVGGSVSGMGNLISGNGFGGIQIQGDGTGSNTVQGNFIGTDLTGNVALGNSGIGVDIDGSSANTIGGTAPGAGNTISGNQNVGIFIQLPKSTNNLVQGNFIGTNTAGTAALPNEGGICIQNGASQTTVGGATPGSRNLISGNGQFGGICIGNDGTSQNAVQGNFIGTDVSGVNPLPNDFVGIRIFDSAFDNTVGGTTTGVGNTIAFNNGGGLLVELGSGNAIEGNSIFSNSINGGAGLLGLGIDLNSDGVTANDAGDSDTGPNDLQNFPDLSSAISANGNTTIQGTLNSTAGASFRIEFFANDACDDSGNGEGQTFLGSADVTADGSGNATLNVTLPTALSGTKFITATATGNGTKDTSEFSKCLQATVLVENCTNGTDDDTDNLIDCADPDCAADPACASKVEICDNNIDDDGDGLTDCNDPDCSTDPACQLVVSGSGCSLDNLHSTPNASAQLLLLLAMAGMWLMRKRI
jgi:hypothetical protein